MLPATVGATTAGNAVPVGDATWADPKLGAAWVPTIITDAGWRPGGVPPTPIPEPEPRPEPEPQPHTSLFAARAPAQIETESQAYELGTKVRVTKVGVISGLRVYLYNSSAQTTRLWKDGKVVATANVPGGTGWAQADITPVRAAVCDILIVSVGKSGSQKYATNTGELSGGVSG